MEYIYGALLLHYAKQEISEEKLTKVLEAAGISPDEVRVKTLVAALKEVNIDEVIKSAAFVPTAAAAAAAPAPSPQPAPAKEEKKKEEEKKGPSEEEIASSLASLF